MACHRARGHQQQQSLLSFTFLSSRGMSGFTANHIPTLPSWLCPPCFLYKAGISLISWWLYLCQCSWSIHNFLFVLLPRLSDAYICHLDMTNRAYIYLRPLQNRFMQIPKIFKRWEGWGWIVGLILTFWSLYPPNRYKKYDYMTKNTWKTS